MVECWLANYHRFLYGTRLVVGTTPHGEETASPELFGKKIVPYLISPFNAKRLIIGKPSLKEILLFSPGHSKRLIFGKTKVEALRRRNHLAKLFPNIITLSTSDCRETY